MSINDINNELSQMKSPDELKPNKKGIEYILENNIKQIENFMDRKIVNIYSRPWNKLEPKLKKDKILQFIKLQIEKEVYSPETANSITKTLLNEVSKNRKIKVEYDIENCVIKSIKI